MVWPKQVRHVKGRIEGSHNIKRPRKSGKGKMKKNSLIPVYLQPLAGSPNIRENREKMKMYNIHKKKQWVTSLLAEIRRDDPKLQSRGT